MNMKKTLKTILAIALAVLSGNVFAQKHTEINLKTWEFSHDKQSWQTVQVPHDWAIAGPFDKKWDMQTVAIVQNGERKASEKTGRSGALPWIGEGHYRTNVPISAELLQNNAHVMLCFDGAMAEPKVSVNGKFAGEWAYGYNAFRLDVTPYVHAGNNLVEVDLKNLEESSRWYPGAGLYRPVTLIVTGASYIDPWQTSVRTTRLGEGVDNHGNTEPQASIDYETTIQNPSTDMACVIDIISAKGAFETGLHVDVPADGHIKHTMTLGKPFLWTPESPYLYKVRTRLFRNHKVVDEIVTNLGVRTVEVTKDGGFMLNGVSRKIQGVCLHHDLGPLGAAVNKAALVRQVSLMKSMGCDAIRTSHNMPSSMQMDVCDSLGMMVMAESFDMWVYPKCKNGYARFFKDWGEKDITNLVLNHRNHPSIVMWSIGNEIPDQGSQVGLEWSKKLQDLCHQLDPTRPVTQGIDRVDAALKSNVLATMDVPGLNYRTQKYAKAYKDLPQGFILGSETASTVSSRGVYKLPYKVTNWAVHEDGQCSGYDNEWCSWSNLPDVDFELMDDMPWTIGQFVWTGIDYLGEPTPYDGYWPSRSSYFGICDLAGLPKDRYYLYRSVWNKNEHTLHILPHWTWPGMEGKNVPVQVYTDYPEAELFINGKSQGRIRKQIVKNPEAGTEQSDPNGRNAKAPNLDRYRLRWMETVYEPGEVKVVAYDEKGQKAAEEVVRTAGEAAQLVLDADKKRLSADGDDLAYITVTLCDKDGNVCPDAADGLEISVEGAATFKAICNGDATSLESFVEPKMQLFHGKLVVTVQSGLQKGAAKVTVKRPAVVTGKGKKTKTVQPEIIQSIVLDVK